MTRIHRAHLATLLLAAALLALLLAAQPSHAQSGEVYIEPDAALEQHATITTDCKGAGGFVPLECFQGSRKLVDAYRTDDLGPFMNKVFVGAISLGAILAVFRLAWAGFVYLSSDLWTNKEHAKEIIKETFLGLFLLLGIWLILYQINPDILKLKIEMPSIPQQTSGVDQASTGNQWCRDPGFGSARCGFSTQQACESDRWGLGPIKGGGDCYQRIIPSID